MKPKYVTIRGFEKYTLQQIFNMSAAHLLTTRERSERPSGGCIYSGIGCAAAPFIRQSEHARCDRLSMDSSVANGSGWLDLQDANLVPSHFAQQIAALQGIHDHHPVRDWSAELQKFAIQYNLNTSVLSTGVS